MTEPGSTSSPRELPDDAGMPGQSQGSLTPTEAEMLAFERQWWKFAGAKEQAIRELFDLSATRYYQVLNRLIDRPEALQFDPMLVKRLRRTREARRRNGATRSSSATGG
jgi:hypothetical protein